MREKMEGGTVMVCEAQVDDETEPLLKFCFSVKAQNGCVSQRQDEDLMPHAKGKAETGETGMPFISDIPALNLIKGNQAVIYKQPRVI